MPSSVSWRLRHGRRVEVGERGGRRRVGEVVGGHVDRLHRRDRALVRRGDPLLQLAHLGGEGRLVTDGRGDAAEERRHLGARLGEAEDVVDEEQHVLVLFVAEVLGDGERRERDAGAGARRLVHLAVHEDALRVLEVVGLEHARLDHLVVEVVPLAGALADAGEHREAAVGLGDVVDELHEEHGLADAGAAEEADLAAAEVRGQQVDDLDAGLERLDLDVLVDEGRRGAMDREPLHRVDGPLLVHGLADHVEDAAEHGLADWHRDVGACVLHGHAANEPLGGVHRDAARGVLAEVLGDLDREVVRAGVDARVGDRERGVDVRQRSCRELHVHDRADDLVDLAVLKVRSGGHVVLSGILTSATRRRSRSPSAPS